MSPISYLGTYAYFETSPVFVLSLTLLLSRQLVTFKNNYITNTSGRAPKVTGNTLVHVVNSYWENNSGHAFEIDAGGMVIAEGNVFSNVNEPIEAGYAGQLFSSPSAEENAVCEGPLGHVCEVNSFESSGELSGSDSDFLVNAEGRTVAGADPAASIGGVKASAGFGTI